MQLETRARDESRYPQKEKPNTLASKKGRTTKESMSGKKVDQRGKEGGRVRRLQQQKEREKREGGVKGKGIKRG